MFGSHPNTWCLCLCVSQWSWTAELQSASGPNDHLRKVSRALYYEPLCSCFNWKCLTVLKGACIFNMTGFIENQALNLRVPQCFFPKAVCNFGWTAVTAETPDICGLLTNSTSTSPHLRGKTLLKHHCICPKALVTIQITVFPPLPVQWKPCFAFMCWENVPLSSA